jgi:ribose-phosphate pyrophosphokinase
MQPILFHTASYEALANSIRTLNGYEAGQREIKYFPDGERYQRVLTEVMSRDVVLVGGTPTEPDTLELYDLACALARQGARTLTLVIPYFAYSTMERAIKPGEVVTAKTRARLLSSIPQAQGTNRVVLLDLHAEGLPHYFEGSITPVHLYAKQVILEEVRRLGGSDFVVACTDAGRAKWVESLANDLNVTPAFVFKRRLDGNTTQVTAVSAQVQGKRVVLFDDMIRTGGSLINAAKAYSQAGASSVAAIATHGVFPGDALDRIRNSGLFTEVVVTDTHPQAMRLQDGFLKVVSVAGIFADFLRKELA